MKKYFYIAIILTLVPLKQFLAQSAGLNFTLAIPQGELKKKLIM